MVFSISLLILTQYKDTAASNLVSSLPMWLMCSFSRAYNCIDVGNMFVLSFIPITSMTAVPSQNGLYWHISSLRSV